MSAESYQQFYLLPIDLANVLYSKQINFQVALRKDRGLLSITALLAGDEERLAAIGITSATPGLLFLAQPAKLRPFSTLEEAFDGLSLRVPAHRQGM